MIWLLKFLWNWQRRVVKILGWNFCRFDVWRKCVAQRIRDQLYPNSVLPTKIHQNLLQFQRVFAYSTISNNTHLLLFVITSYSVESICNLLDRNAGPVQIPRHTRRGTEFSHVWCLIGPVSNVRQCGLQTVSRVTRT